MARALAVNGASKVFVIGRRMVSLESVAKSHDAIVPIQGDVTSKESLDNMVAQVKKHVDHIDILIANSGISGPSGTMPPKENKSEHTLQEVRDHLYETPMEEVTKTFEVNITGALYTALAFLPLLDAANEKHPPPSSDPRSQIIITSSIGAFNRVPAAGFAYSASKAGVVHMVKQMSTLLSKYNIRVNSIAPGLYLSEMTQKGLEKAGKKDSHQEGSFDKAFIPATRTGDEQDIAGVILWLCSRAGSYVSGSIITTDGGKLAVTPAAY